MTLTPDEVTAVCAVLGAAAGLFLFSVNAIVSRQFSRWMEKIEDRFVSKDRFEGLEVRVDRLEERPSLRARAGGD